MILTVRDAEEALKRVELVNPPFQIDRYIWGGNLQVVTHVRERRTGSDAMIRFHFPIPLPISEDSFFAFVASRVRATILHEFEESFHVDGVRTYEPHPPENPGALISTFHPERAGDPYREPSSWERAREHEPLILKDDHHPLDLEWARQINAKARPR